MKRANTLNAATSGLSRRRSRVRAPSAPPNTLRSPAAERRLFVVPGESFSSHGEGRGGMNVPPQDHHQKMSQSASDVSMKPSWSLSMPSLHESGPHPSPPHGESHDSADSHHS